MALLFLIILISGSVNIYSLDINTAINIALSNDIELKEISNKLILQKLKILNKILDFYPNIVFNTFFLKPHNLSEFNINANVNINYNIYDYGYRKILFDLESLRYENLLLLYKMKLKEIKFNTKSLFYDALIAKKILNLRENNIKQAIIEKKQNEEKYKNGFIDKLSYCSSEQYFLISEYNLLLARNEIRQKLSSLKNFLLYYNFDLVTGDIIKEEFNKLAINDLRIIQLEIQKNIEELNYKSIISANEWRFDIYFSGNFSYNIFDSAFNFPNLEVGIKIYLPIFDWLSIYFIPNYNIQNLSLSDNFCLSCSFSTFNNNNCEINKKEAEVRFVTILSQLNFQIKQIESENDIADDKLLELELAIYNASNEIEFNKLNYNKVKILYEKGDKSAKEFLDAKISIIESEVNYYRKVLEYNKFVWKRESVIE